MNKHNFTRDFIAYILLDYTELLSDINYYFYPEWRKQQIENIPEYSLFLRNELKEVPDFIDNSSVDLKGCENIFRDSEISELTLFLNDNFRHGFPDDVEDGLVSGGNYQLNLEEDDLRLYLKSFLEYKIINPQLYTSYFFQLFEVLSGSIDQEIVLETRKLKQIIEFDKIENSVQSKHLLKSQKELYDKMLLDQIRDNKFVIFGKVDIPD